MSDPMTALVERMRPVCARAVDADEVAAVLEANGINDRVAARDYDVTSVFSLAAAVLLKSGTRNTDETLVDAVEVRRTPVRRLPLTTKGALVFGWGLSQALAYLGYCVLGTAGRTGAARLLAVGFGLVAAGWGALLWLRHVPWPTGYLVSGAQLALFAATAVALVTGTERRVLLWAVPCWVSSAALLANAGVAADVGLLGSLAVLAIVAYRPVIGRVDAPPGACWPRPGQLFASIGYGLVGAGQAVLFVLVVLLGVGLTPAPIDVVPLLVGVPLIELLLVWHQRRVADGRATLDERAAFGRHLARVSRGTMLALCAPVFLGAAMCAPLLAGAGHGEPLLATSVLLTSVYALCLVLVTHRRLGTAAVLVWWPAALIAITARALPGWAHLPVAFTHWVTGLTLFAVCLPALVVVALVIRDPWSYR
jgi:hypothetical protein